MLAVEFDEDGDLHTHILLQQQTQAALSASSGSCVADLQRGNDHATGAAVGRHQRAVLCRELLFVGGVHA